MIFAVETHTGKRISNEDNFLMPEPGQALPLIAVADGMGGHAAGRRASTLAVEGLAEVLGEDLRHGMERQGIERDPVQRLREAIRKVNLDIFIHSKEEEGCRGMGTTLTLALLFPDHYIAANVGDSRVYHFDGWSLTQVTHDHSLVAVLVATGEITLEESYMHPHRNIITRALGTAEYEEADYFQRNWQVGDTLLLCSDGLHGSLSEEAIADILREDQAELSLLARRLVDAALDAGSMDNITVALARNMEGGPV